MRLLWVSYYSDWPWNARSEHGYIGLPHRAQVDILNLWDLVGIIGSFSVVSLNDRRGSALDSGGIDGDAKGGPDWASA
jgi:hypothetical protein